MQTARDVLTPDALAMLQAIAKAGSFAAAARQMGMVPSALTYRVRQMEEALDVLLFDRSSRQARTTPAGAELLREAERLLQDMDAVAHRVKRVATGWESQFSIALDTLISRTTVMELCEAFYALKAPTRIRLRDETLSGTFESLASGQADLAIGIGPDAAGVNGLQVKRLGSTDFVFAVAPHHPIASAAEPLSDDLIRSHRAVAVADSNARGKGMTFGILSGQQVFTVATMQDKMQAQLRGLGVGHLPLCMAQRHIDAGHLVVKSTERARRQVTVHYAWRSAKTPTHGRSMQWWLAQLERPATRTALLDRHAQP